jgi:hypothetical protein
VKSVVSRDFRVKSYPHGCPLPDTHNLAAGESGNHLTVGTNPGDQGGSNERDMDWRALHTGDRDICFMRVHLRTKGISAHRHIQSAQCLLTSDSILQFTGEQNEARARTEHR